MNIKYSRYDLGVIGGIFSGLFATAISLTIFDFGNITANIVYLIAAILFLLIYLFYKKQLKRWELDNGQSSKTTG